jgi:predicted short-subunit dehydrogenase-like oxidoreductase (DUF2520 family)
VGSCHPLLSFADPAIAARLLPSAAFALEGDPSALAEAARLVSAIGGRALRVDAGDRALYHAAAATASNHLVALVAQAAACLGALGIERAEATSALVPLLQSTLDNLARLDVPRALTGPVSRGDHQCVENHLRAIEARAPQEALPYIVMALRAAVVARERATAPSDALSKVERTLSTRLAALAPRPPT